MLVKQLVKQKKEIAKTKQEIKGFKQTLTDIHESREEQRVDLDDIDEAGQKLFQNKQGDQKKRQDDQSTVKLPPTKGVFSQMGGRLGGVSASIGGRSTHMTMANHGLSRIASSQ